MKLLSFFLISNLLLSTNAFAHGEDKYGPNKGFIKMPGAFHTEVVPSEDGSYRVYLLDFYNKNATVSDSSVDLKIKNARKENIFNCNPIEDLYYHCTSKEKVSAKGQLILTAKRLGSQGRPAIYDLPLKLKEVKNNHDHH